MNVAAYIRVSSKSQDLRMQRAAIEKAAAARGDTIGEWYAEKQSAKTMSRPELDRLRADARAGNVRRCYCFKYDRLCRTGVRDLLNVVEEFRLAGCEIIAVADVVDLAGPAAEMILAALAFAARIERQAINERVSAARERVEAEGGSWGRPRRSFNVERAQALRDEGKTTREIAMALRVPRSTIARRLVPKTSAV